MLIIPTGYEIVAPEEVQYPIQPGVILEVNGQVLASMIAECGAESTLVPPVPDILEKIKEAVSSGLAAGYDIVLTIAGSSNTRLDECRCWSCLNLMRIKVDTGTCNRTGN